MGPAGMRKLLLFRAGMVLTLFPQDGVTGLAKEVMILSLKAGNSEAEKKTKLPNMWKCQEFGKKFPQCSHSLLNLK